MKDKTIHTLCILIGACALSASSFAQDIKFDPNDCFQIVSNHGPVLSNQGSLQDGTNIFLADPVKNERSQAWSFIQVDEEYYLVFNPDVNKGLDNGGVHSGNGNTLAQWPANPGNSNQLWKLTRVKGDTYIFTSKTSGMNLGYRDAGPVGDPVFQYPANASDASQQWTLRKTEIQIEAERFKTSSTEDRENETVFGINRLPGRTTFYSYPSVESMKTDPAALRPWLRPNSPNYLLLNGMWKFHWVKQPSERPANFYKPAYNVSQWTEIPVPSCMEMQGYGTPIYSNITYPFRNKAPFIQPQKGYTAVEEPNPVGSYRRSFTLPASWEGHPVYLHFDGVYSAMYVWVNGKKVGYSQGSTEDAEFDITPYVRSGENILAVEVYRWCDGSYLEDQDMFRMSGIFRDVYLIGRPDVHIRDFRLTSEWKSADLQHAVLHADIDVLNTRAKHKAGYSLSLTILDKDGKTCGQVAQRLSDMGGRKEARASLQLDMEHPLLWSAETPHLYTVVAELKDRTGKTVEATCVQYGFRKIEIRNRRVYVNNRPVWFKGVNRHDIHPQTGKTVLTESMLTDVLLFKQNNINTLRTCHYPNDTKMYALCDYYGIYVMDEANIECHGNMEISKKSLGYRQHDRQAQSLASQQAVSGLPRTSHPTVHQSWISYVANHNRQQRLRPSARHPLQESH